MKQYVVKFVKNDGGVIYYTNKIQWSQDTFLGTEDFNHATFYKVKGTAIKVMKDSVRTFKAMKDDNTRNYRYKDEVGSVISVSVVAVNMVEGETESEEFLAK